ncbi:MAG: hypothetical protein PHV20_00705 [Bacteroidales bacterium]|nr:hypothetical protein [Bacteroidales bacterium]
MYIPILENPKNNIAVWRAAEIHFKYIYKCNEPINIIIRDKNTNDLYANWNNSFNPSNVLTYSSKLELFLLIRKLKNEKFFCLTVIETVLVIFCRIFKKSDIYYWMQGIIPEEDYLKNKSIFRKISFLFAERLSLTFSDKVIFVSDYMKEYIEKHRKVIVKNFAIMPCTSSLEYKKKERIPDSFVYIGGLSAWQKVDKAIILFCNIHKAKPNSKLFLYSFNIQGMKELVDKNVPKHLQKHITIDRLDGKDKISEVLSTMEYGFLIRDNNPINNVSSPIKLAEYLSCGVNLIISKSIKSYAPLINTYQCGIVVENNEDISIISSHTFSHTNAISLYNDKFNDQTIISEYKKLLI